MRENYWFSLRALAPVMSVAALLVAIAILFLHLYAQEGRPIPVFRVDYSNPTRDKLQSKLWYAHGSWWAWLPDGEGSSIWQRTASGWTTSRTLNDQLAHVSGLADVASSGNLVSAVVSAPTSIQFVVLEYVHSKKFYSLHQKPKKWEFDGPGHPDYPDMYASLARDATNAWWISYLRGDSVWVVASKNAAGSEWLAPVRIGRAITGWDNAVLFPIYDGMGLMWSYQRDGDSAMLYRFHTNGESHDTWSDTEVLDAGPAVAEDHFNVALAPDETVYVSTMNDRNVIGDYSHILRVLDKSGHWGTVPFATLTKEAKPSRTILLGGGAPWRLYIAHNRLIQGPPVRGDIVLRCTRKNDRMIDEATTPILSWPDLDVRGVTSTRDTLPEGVDWLVLASNKVGQIYEGHIAAEQCDVAGD